MNQNQWQGNGQNGVEPYSYNTGATRAGNPGRLSIRMYGLVLSGLVFAGFAIMGACASLFANPAFLIGVMDHYGVVSILSFVASIAGLMMMGRARSTESMGLSLAGYAVFVLSFGFTTSILLLAYPVATVSTAFLATAGVTAVFGCLGIAFPGFFQKIQGVCAAGLLAVILVQCVMMLFGVSTTIVDFIVIVIFCGFIGYDFHKAMSDEPTMVSAVYNASQLFLDILNVFVRILSILGHRD